MAKKGRGSKKPDPPPKKRRGKRKIQMMVISKEEAEGKSVIEYTGEGTVVFEGVGKGPGSDNEMVCGNCGATLIKGGPVSRFQSLVLICRNCGAFNETLA